jgi:hypothetical protein
MEKEFTISFTDNKSADWKILTLEVLEGDGSVMYQDVSVNRVNKKGETFPNFDNLKVGERVKGNLWTSPQGKHYLFAPNLSNVKSGASGGGFKAGMQKMVEQRNDNINKIVDRKEEGIKVSSTMRDAVQIALAELGSGTDHVGEKDIAERIQYWRQWLWQNWDCDDGKFPPFK